MEPKAPKPDRPSKPIVAVEDDQLRERLKELLGTSGIQFEVVDPDVDPLTDPVEDVADLLILRRATVRPHDLKRLSRFVGEDSNPDLLVISDEANEGERARLLSAGVSGVLGADDTAREIRDAVEALANPDRSNLRSPSAGRGESEASLADFHSRSPRMQRFLDLVGRVVDTDSALLITGETGVGKERLAQAIHNEGNRKNGPFVSVNCGAIPSALLESELFGHEAGAFTGANRQKRGRFELASGGTIFLDEIGEMPLDLQVNLLTVLQRHRLQRVGSESLVEIDVRVMAATNRDLEALIQAGRFREDLFYRLNVVNLEIPPLRERAEDIPDLVGTFIHYFRSAVGRRNVEGISDKALQALQEHPWPGNVRQLVNAIEHAVVLCRGQSIELEDLPSVIRSQAHDRAETSESRTIAPTPSGIDRWLDRPLREAKQAVSREFERDYLRAQLAKQEGRVGRTAKAAGITARSLYDKMKRLGLKKEDFRPS